MISQQGYSEKMQQNVIKVKNDPNIFKFFKLASLGKK
jgi:hypothetical protein